MLSCGGRKARKYTAQVISKCSLYEGSKVNYVPAEAVDARREKNGD